MYDVTWAPHNARQWRITKRRATLDVSTRCGLVGCDRRQTHATSRSASKVGAADDVEAQASDDLAHGRGRRRCPAMAGHHVVGRGTPWPIEIALVSDAHLKTL